MMSEQITKWEDNHNIMKRVNHYVENETPVDDISVNERLVQKNIDKTRPGPPMHPETLERMIQTITAMVQAQTAGVTEEINQAVKDLSS